MINEIGNINGEPILQSKTVTQNGTVSPDSGYDGLSSVTINVPSDASIKQYIGASLVQYSNTTTAETGITGTDWIYSRLASEIDTPSGEEQVICTQSKINLSNMSKIYMLCKWWRYDTNWSNGIAFGISEEAPSSADNAINIAEKIETRLPIFYSQYVGTDTSVSSPPVVAELMDVSDITGSYYIWIATKLLYNNSGRGMYSAFCC